MEMHTFDATLERPDGVGTWTYLRIPLDMAAVYGAKGQVNVVGTINDHPYCDVALPSGDGTHYLVVNKSIRDAIAATTGDVVHVAMARGDEPRHVSVAPDFQQALDSYPEAGSAFAALSYSHQREFADWIAGAKRPETRQRRIRSAVERIAAKQPLTR